jgi:SAM-dependent methyltransferase
MSACWSAFECTADQQFNEKKATEELKRYRTKGPGPTTRLLQEGVAHAGTLRGTLLDIGSGIGSPSFGLLERGITRAVAVDASSAYNVVARQEAERLGRANVVRLFMPTLYLLRRSACCNTRHARPRGVLLPVVRSAPERGALPRGTVSSTLVPTGCVVCAPRSDAGKRARSSEEELIPDVRTSSWADGRRDSGDRFRVVHKTGDVDVVGRRLHAARLHASAGWSNGVKRFLRRTDEKRLIRTPIDRMAALASLCVQAGLPAATQYAVMSPAGVPRTMVFSVANSAWCSIGPAPGDATLRAPRRDPSTPAHDNWHPHR